MRPQHVADAGAVAVLGPDGLPVAGIVAGPAGAATSFQAFLGDVSDAAAAPQPLLLADDLSGVAAPDEEGGGGAPAAAEPVAAPAPRTAKEVLDMLNLKRGLEGSWADSDEVLRAVTSLAAGGGEAEERVAAARAARPEALSGEQWATVLALAFLRKRCGAERSTWEGMEAKALGWLAAGWPAGAKSVGVTVLTASKWV